MYVKSVRKMQKISDKKISVRKQILAQIKPKSKNGFIWSELLSDKFKRNDIDVALHTFAKKEIIKKIINGLYYTKPRKKPSMEDIANIIGLKNGFEPVKTNDQNVYLSVLPRTRRYAVGNEILTFKAVSPKRVPIKSDTSQSYLYAHDTSENRNERYTPAIIVDILIPYVEMLYKKLNRPITIWCPADTKESEYYKVLSKLSYAKVITTHISQGIDFLTYTPTFEFDAIIVNPPFEGKSRWLKKILEYNKSFAVLLPSTYLADRSINVLYGQKQIQMLIPDRRVSFGNIKGKQVTFKSIYYCWNFLDRDVVLCNLYPP